MWKYNIQPISMGQWNVVEKFNPEECRIVDYYRTPLGDGNYICLKCGFTMHDHGYINDDDIIVCPGDWIYRYPNGTYFTTNNLFRSL